MGPERAIAANAKVQKLLQVSFILDFTDLNKVCPKDSYPLPKIDKLVDATAGHSPLSFMDAFFGCQ